MATEALFPPKNLSRTTYRPINRRMERIFFSGMAILLCIVVIIGFSRTYFLAGMVRAPLPNALVHVHGAVFTLWMTLYLVQTALISAHRVAWHRTFGTIAFCLPPIMIVLGSVASIDGLRRGVRIGPLDPSVSLAISLIGMVAFTVLITASWLARRKPDAHKRLILLATMGLTEAAFGRFPWKSMGVPPAAGAVIGLSVLIVLLISYDLFSLHRIHRTTLWAAPFAWVFGVFVVPIGMTPMWHSFAGFLARNVAPHV